MGAGPNTWNDQSTRTVLWGVGHGKSGKGLFFDDAAYRCLA
jgi:hypothetical protein